tara:strand:- start:394 stop:543 length:150 start_codon:yes stop_codon:yes gene_type:complete
MSLSGTEWQELAVLSRLLGNLESKKNLTDNEKCVIIWLMNEVKILKEKK